MERVAFLEGVHYAQKPQIDMMAETPFSKEIRICMAPGNIMSEHTAPGAITIMVLHGCVAVASETHRLELCSGEMVAFEANVPHSLEAVEHSVVRLTLSKNDSVKRVISLV
jgi:quercetin dioxygenase-like cupin family protein